LADFQKNISEFEKRNIIIIGASTDTIENAVKTQTDHCLTYTIAFGLDGKEFSSLTGAFYDGKDGYAQGTGIIIGPDGRVADAVYSTGPIGRYTSAECLGMIDYLSKKSG
jgi:peroxiredoxin